MSDQHAPTPGAVAAPNGNGAKKTSGYFPRATREGLIQAIELLLAHLPQNVLYTVWKLLSYPPAQLRRAQLMIMNCPESSDLFYDAVRMDRIVRYLDAKTEEGLMKELENGQAKEEARKSIEQFRGRIGMAITILRSQMAEVARKFKVSIKGLARLGGYEKVYERSGQRMFQKGQVPADSQPEKHENLGEERAAA